MPQTTVRPRTAEETRALHRCFESSKPNWWHSFAMAGTVWLLSPLMAFVWAAIMFIVAPPQGNLALFIVAVTTTIGGFSALHIWLFVADHRRATSYYANLEKHREADVADGQVNETVISIAQAISVDRQSLWGSTYFCLTEDNRVVMIVGHDLGDWPLTPNGPMTDESSMTDLQWRQRCPRERYRVVSTRSGNTVLAVYPEGKHVAVSERFGFFKSVSKSDRSPMVKEWVDGDNSLPFAYAITVPWEELPLRLAGVTLPLDNQAAA